MRKFGAVIGVLVLGTTLSGCWEQPGYDAGHTNWNAGEHVITAANVDQLTQLWTYGVSDGPVRSPLSIAGKVFAVGRGTFYDQIVRLEVLEALRLLRYSPAPGSGEDVHVRRQLEEGMWAAVPERTSVGRREARMIKAFAEIPRDDDRVIFFPRAAGGA